MKAAWPRTIRALTVGVCLASVSCDASALGRGADPELVRSMIVPDSAYRGWWDELQICSGTTADFDRVRFFEVVSPLFIERSQFPCGGGFFCNGIWEPPHDVTLAPAFLGTERLVKHEMLHDLLEVFDHPAVFETCEASWDFSDLRGRRGPVP